jgi:hypothetical protein
MADKYHAFPEKKEHINAIIEVDNAFIVMPFHSDPVEVLVKVIPMIKEQTTEMTAAILAAEDDKFHYVHHYPSGGFLVHVMFPLVGSYNILIFLRERRKTYKGGASTSTTTNIPPPSPSSLTIKDTVDENTSKYDLSFEYVVKSKKGLMYNVGFPIVTRFMRKACGRVVAPLQGALTYGSTCSFKIQLPTYFIAVMVRVMNRVKCYLNNDKSVPDVYTFYGEVELEPELDETFKRQDLEQYLREMRTTGETIIAVELLGFDEYDAGWKPLVNYDAVQTLKQLNFGDKMNIPQFFEVDIPEEIEAPTSETKSGLSRLRRIAKVITFVNVLSTPSDKQKTANAPTQQKFSVSSVFSPFIDTQFRKQFNVQLVTHPFMWITTKHESLTMKVLVGHPDLKLRVLPLEQYGTVMACRTTWIGQPQEGVYFLKVVCPRPELYIFKVEGRVGDHEPFLLLRYVIDCTQWQLHGHPKSSSSMHALERRVDVGIDSFKHELSYPTVYPAFYENKCILFLPYEILVAGKTYLFKVRVQGAEHVGLMTSGNWQALSCSDDELGMFEGYIKVSDSPSSSLPPDATLCISQRKTLQPNTLVFGDDENKNAEQEEEDDFDDSGGDHTKMIKLCEWHVLKVGQDIAPPEYNLLAEYDDETLVEPTPEMLRYLRFVSHKRKLIEVKRTGQDFQENTNLQPHVTIVFKRVVGSSFLSTYPRQNTSSFVDQVSDFQFLVGNLSHEVQKIIKREIREAKTKEFAYYENEKSHQDDDDTIILTGELYDSLSEIQGAVLVQQSSIGLRTTNQDKNYGAGPTEYYQVHVTLPLDRTSRRYLLRIRVIVIGKWRREYEGVTYWLQVRNETISKEVVSAIMESSAKDLDENEFNKKKDYDLTLTEVYGLKSFEEKEEKKSPFATISKSKMDHFSNMFAQYLTHTPQFGFVRIVPSTAEWFRLTIYQPTHYLLERGVHSRVKVKVHNTTSVAVCCCIQSRGRVTSDYFDWHYLENDQMAYLETGDKADASEMEYRENKQYLYEGEVCFTYGTHAMIMARVDSGHYTPVATYELV